MQEHRDPTRAEGTGEGATDGSSARRPHTGRRRNEAARAAVLDAAATLLARCASSEITIDAIAAEAGVGRQTIYRWWPSKGAVLLEAMNERAAGYAPDPDTGSLEDDLREFLSATFRGATASATALRGAAAEALRDPNAERVFREFTARRREVLRGLLSRGRQRGELPATVDVDLLVDQAYGLLWYRLLAGHASLTTADAEGLARSLLSQGRDLADD